MAGLSLKKQVLVVGNEGVQVYAVSGKNVSLYADISSRNDDFRKELEVAFRAIGSPILVLLDVVEQQYRKEILPAVSFLDRSKVIQRKLQMAFPQHDMRSFLLMQKKEAEGESLTALFAALSSSPLIDMVIDAIMASEVGVVGAGLLPLESTSLITKLVKETHQRAQTPDDTRWSILMTYHQTGGLRQIVIKDGELALTRMTPIMATNGSAQIAEEMVREFNATLTYLSRFGYIPSDGIDLIIVTSSDVCQLLRHRPLQVTHLYPLTLQEANQLLGLSMVMTDESDPHADIVHAAWLGTQKKIAVPMVSSVLGKVKMARQVSKIAIGIFLVAALYFAYENVMLVTGGMTEQTGIVEQRARSMALRQEVDNLSKSLNTLKYDPEKTRVVLGVYDEYKNKNIAVDPILQAIISQLDRQAIHIRELNLSEETAEATVTQYQQAATAAVPTAPGMDDGMAPDQPNGLGGSPMGNPSMGGPAMGNPTMGGPQMMPPTGAPSPQMGMNNAPANANMAAQDAQTPVLKPVVTINMTIGFSEDMTIEQAAKATNEFVEKLRKRLPGRDVTVNEIIGNLSETKTVEGRSEQVAADRVEGRLVKNDSVSKLTIKGMLE